MSVWTSKHFKWPLGRKKEPITPKHDLGASSSIDVPSAHHSLLSQVRLELRNGYSRPDPSTEAADSVFMTLPAVRTVLNRDRLEKLLRPYSWSHKDLIEVIYKGSLRVIATLITIEWTGWDEFESIFLHATDQSGRPVRGDHKLPFDFQDLAFLGPFQNLFDSEQYIFCPLIITEGSSGTYNERVRLPFIKSLEVRDGSFGAVIKQEIEKHQILFTSSKEHHYNTQRHVMAVKVFKNPNSPATRGFKVERDILQLLREASLGSKGICMNFATFEHGRTLNIISTWADLDLFGFLIGTYDDYPNRARSFTPWHLFEQTRCLAQALLFLHEELDIEGPVTCAHLDLKPENVLVEWQTDNADDAESNTNSRKPVGLWKINDFGISTVRSRDTQTGSGAGSSLSPGDIFKNFWRERSSLSAPRDSGAFLPPEMKKISGKKGQGTSSHVSKESDMWSLGCIMAMVLAFTLDGPEKAKQLYDCRNEGYEDDFFYCGEPPTIKPEVEDWFKEQLVAPKYVTERHWISKCHLLFLQLTKIEKNERPTAKVASEALRQIRNLAGSKLPWSTMPDRPYPPQGGRHYPQSTPSRSAAVPNLPSRSAAVPNLPSRSAVVPNFPSRSIVRSPSPDDNAPETQTTDIRHLSLSTTRTRQGSESWVSASIRLQVPPRMVRASMSPDGRRIGLVGKALAYLYDFEETSPTQSRWRTLPAEVERVSKQDFGDAVQEVRAPAGREWNSALLAGSFVVLMSTSIQGTGNDPIAHLYEVNFEAERPSPIVKELDHFNLSDKYVEVRLSPKGALIVVNEDNLELYIGDSSGALTIRGKPLKAVFSVSGDWLCAWYKAAGQNCWSIWDLRTTESKRAGHQTTAILDPPPRGTALLPLLLPFHQEPRFAAIDAYGRSWLIRPGGKKEPEAFENNCEGAIAGAVVPTDNEVLILRKIQGIPRHRVDLAQFERLVPVPRISSRALTQLDSPFDAFKCGLAVVSDTSQIFLLTISHDGTLVRRSFILE